MKKKYYLSILLIIALAGLNSCKKFVEIGTPKTQLITTLVFSDNKTATAAVAGMYSYMCQSVTFGGTHNTLFTGLSADELTRPALPGDAFFNNNIPSNDGAISSLWQNAYASVYQANAILEGLDASSGVTPALKNQLKGEALFIRAFCHFYLVNLFGDTPYITSTEVNLNRLSARTSKATVYEKILSDLNTAKELVANDYTSYFSGERVRANKWVIYAFLARVYLYTGDWTNAESNSSLVIANSSLFALSADLNAVFLKNSKESIFQFLTYGGDGHTLTGNQLIPTSTTVVPGYALPNSLVSAFEPGDKRRANWITTSTANSTTYYRAYKYKQRLAQATSALGEYDTALRLSEQYLIRSEARAKLGNIGTPLTGALGDLNIVRSRAGLGNSTASDKMSLLQAIEQERRVELFVEWGHRWLDLKRTGRIDAVLSAVKPGWKSTSALFPLPLIELSNNPSLVQNPGYE